MARVLTIFGFRDQYESLYQSSRRGSGARGGYKFLAATLNRVMYLSTARSAVQARLVSLGREVNGSRGHRQASVLDQIAVLEHFLEEIKGRDD